MIVLLGVLGALAFLVVLIVVIFVVPAVTKGAAENAAHQLAKVQSLSQVPGFTPAIVHEGHSGSYGLALDPASNRFAIAIPGREPRLYHFSQLVAVEVERNGTTVTTTKGKIDTKGAALGTALIGPVGGLMAGAKTSSTSTSVETVELTLKLFVSDLYTPCFAIPFGGGDTTGWDENYTKAVQEIDSWYGRFRTILAGLEGKRSDVPHADAIIHNEPAPKPVMLGWAARTFSA